VKTLESKETRAQRKKTVTHNSVFAAHRLKNAVPRLRDGIFLSDEPRISRIGYRTRLACWFRRLAETIFESGNRESRKTTKRKGFNLARYELPISTPVMKTSAPPKPTCNAAETVGVSIYRCRIQVIVASSTSTTPKATTIATRKAGIKNGNV